MSIRSLLKVYLMEFSFTYSEAANGEEGLRQARKSKPDLIIVDLLMPVMDGAQFLAELRKDPELGSTPVIVLSADENETGRLSSAPNARTYVAVKPIDPATFKSVVRTALQLA